MGDPRNIPVVRRSTNVLRDPPRQWFCDYLPVTGDNQIELLVDGEDYGKSLHAALQGAAEEVMLTGLHFQPTYRLIRGGGSANADLNHPDCLLQVLRSLAQKGVKIYLLVNQFWANEWTTVNPILKKIKKEGHLDWYLPETSALFTGLAEFPNVMCRTDVHKGFVMSTHHQKTVIIDKKIAFVGGIDLTLVDGDRWDTHDHTIPDAAPPQRADGSYEAYGPADDRRYSLPEHFWHDVHSKVEGPAVQFVLDNFHARWNHGVLYKDMSRVETVKSRYVRDGLWFKRQEYTEVNFNVVEDEGDHSFERISIEPQTYQDRMRNEKSLHLRKEDEDGPPELVDKCGIDSVPKLPGARIQVVRSMPAGRFTYDEQKPAWNLSDEVWERSAKDVYLIAIRAAREYIYLENQWISDEHIWAELKLAMRRNRDNPDFRIVIMIPRRPLAAAGYGSDQDINLQPHVDRVIAETATADQFGMYCAVAKLPPSRRDNVALSQADIDEFGPETAQIYIHSKCLIVDDRWALIGSANAGGISLLGVMNPTKMFTSGRGSTPDSELSVAVLDEAFGKKFREQAWTEFLEGDMPGSVPAAADKFREKSASPDSIVQPMVLFQKAIEKGTEAVRRVPPLVMGAVRDNSRIVASQDGPVSLDPDSPVGFTADAFQPGGAFQLHYRWILEDDAGQRWNLRAIGSDRVVKMYGPESSVYIPKLTAERLREQLPMGGQAKMLCRVLVTPVGVQPRNSSADDQNYGVLLELPITLDRS